MPTPADHPNVIVFLTDQQRHDSTGVHGNPLDLTPNFDRVARQGTDVHYSFSCAPLCGPARSCLQTGTHISTNSAYTNGISLTDNLPHLADCFNNAGYHTGYIGKWHLSDTGNGAVPKEKRGGYQSWLASNLIEYTSDVYDCVVYNEENNPVKLLGYRVDALADAMIRYIDKHKQEPFFLFGSFLEPHNQNYADDCPPPTGYRQKYAGRWTPPDLAALPACVPEPGNSDQRLIGGTSQKLLGGYWGMVKRLDEAFGRVLDALKSAGLMDNTIVLFTSDHASHFGTRNHEYKRSCHESSIRVPMAITGPGFNGGGRVQEMVTTVDIAPTLINAAGIDIPDCVEGRPLLPLLRGQDKDWPQEAFIQVCDFNTGRAVRTRRWKYCVMGCDGKQQPQLNADQYEESFLYDLEHDPYELSNLIESKDHANVRKVMRDRLIQRMTALGEPKPNIKLAKTQSYGNRKVTEQEALQ